GWIALERLERLPDHRHELVRVHVRESIIGPEDRLRLLQAGEKLFPPRIRGSFRGNDPRAAIGLHLEAHRLAGQEAQRITDVLRDRHLSLAGQIALVPHDLVLPFPSITVNHHHLCGWAANPARCSSATLASSTPCSSNGLPITCSPSGSPSALSPAGTLIAGSPARLARTENTSVRYIASGSSTLSPSAKAAVGVIGARITSHCAQAFSKSRAISARTFCAWV